MRDALLLLIIFSSLVIAMRFPFAGVLAWAWFTLMTPHQMAYGAYGLPLNLIIAAATLGAIAMNGGLKKGDFKTGGLDPINVLMLIFCVWLFVSQMFSLDADNSAKYFDRFIKTMLFVLIVARTANDKLKIHALLWMIVVSLGFFAAKGALFTFVTLGEYRVQGVPNTILEDNNHMGIALASLLPLIAYLRGEAARPLIRFGLAVLFVTTIISIIGTHSRGAFLSLLVFCGYYWLRSKHKISILAALTLLTIPAIAFMPAKWSERMSTIGQATQDESFMGRVDAWVINLKLAAENPVTGAGLRNSYQEEIAKSVDAKRAKSAKAAHSIYFEILGGAGYMGLSIFLSLLAAAFFTSRGIEHRATRRNNRRLSKKSALPTAPPWTGRLAYYCQISLVVFCVGGASVSMEMWDGYWLVIAIISALHRLTAPVQKAAPRFAGPAINRLSPSPA